MQSVVLRLLLALIIICSTIKSMAQNESLYQIWESSLPFITTYTTETYKAELQNWSIVQDDNGIIFVGNNAGILEYDGASWRLIKTARGNPVRSLAKDNQGRIYVGSIGEIGFLAPDIKHGMVFHSLSENIDSTYRDFGNVWQTYSVGSAIFFISDRYIFRWSNNTFKVWSDKDYGEFGFSWLMNDGVYVDIRGQGLMKLTNDTLQLIQNGDKFQGLGLMGLLPYGRDSFLAFCLDREVMLFDRNSLTPLENNGKEVRLPDDVYHGALLSNGDFALATTGSGLYVMDRDGNVKVNISRSEGLTSDAVYAVYEDVEGAVWLATDNGISRVELNSPLRVLNENHGLDENTFDMEYFHGKLYVTSSKGIFQLHENVSSRLAPKPFFEKIKGIDNLTLNCHVIGDNLLIANYDGLFTIDKENNVKCLFRDAVTRVESPSLPNQKSLLFHSQSSNIGELRMSGGEWKVSKHKIPLNFWAYGFVRADNGNVLINTRIDGIYEIEWKNSHSPLLESGYQLIHHGTNSGLSSLSIKLLEKIGSTVYASTSKALHTFQASPHFFAIDSILSNQLNLHPEAWINEIAQGSEESFWVCVYHNFQSRIFKVSHSNAVEFPFSGRFTDALVTKIFDTGMGITFFGSNKRVVMYNHSRKSETRILTTHIRKVAQNQDSIIYAGHPDNTYPSSHIVAHENNSIHFQFSLSSYDHSSNNQYQYFLKGFSSEWSPWSTESKVSFTNLIEGDYVFRVKGKNVYGQAGDEDVFVFKVLPPWYRTWWFYAICLIVFVLTVGGIVNWRSLQLQREKLALEDTIRERTLKISEQAKELRKMNRLKSNFFATISHEFRTPLTLILAPLEDEMKKKTSAQSRENLQLMSRSANRLLELVNQVLDLTKLEAGKMELRILPGNLNNFLSAIAASFEAVAQQKDIAFEKEIELSEKIYWYDADKIEKILNNLLANAFKYTPPGKSVHMSVGITMQGSLSIIVSDTGIGIPLEEQANILTPFYQVRQGSLVNQPGTGLGLSLVKDLVTLYKGNIAFQSMSGIGTSFTITIPVLKDAFHPDQAAGEESNLENSDILNY